MKDKDIEKGTMYARNVYIVPFYILKIRVYCIIHISPNALFDVPSAVLSSWHLAD